MGTILLKMMFFKDNVVATVRKTIAKLCVPTPLTTKLKRKLVRHNRYYRHDARLHLYTDAREPYPTNDPSAKDGSLVSCSVGIFPFFVVYA